MEVLDIFSWLAEKQITLERLEQIFKDYKFGIYNSEYTAVTEKPDDISENALNCRNELIEEGKKVAYILKGKDVIAVIGYRE